MSTQTPEIGDFIRVHGWNASGMVTAIESNADNTVSLMLQEKPEGEERRYRLRAEDFEILD